MALVSLILHHGNQGDCINEVLSHEITELPISYIFNSNVNQNKSYITEWRRTADSLIMKHLEIHPVNDMEIDEFKKLMRDGYLKIIAEHSHVIITYFFGLCMELENVRKINGSFIIQIPFNYTINKLHAICCSFTKILIELNIPNQHLIQNVRVFYDNVYRDSESRRSLAINQQNVKVQLFELLGKLNFSNIKENIATINLTPHIRTKGYFIEGNISNVNKITLTNCNDDNKIVLTYDKKINNPNVQFKQITPYLHWFTNSNIDYKSLEYTNSIGNMQSVNNLSATIEFENLDQINKYSDQIYIHSVSQNNMIYSNGYILGQF